MDDDPPDPNLPTAIKDKAKKRPLRYGDRVKQGQILCVVHSIALGTAKAALVDAVCSLALSKETLERHYKLFAEGSISLATLRQSERQVLTDSNSVLTAERTLLTMKLLEPEVQEVKDEAKKIAELAKNETFKRDAKSEAERWARVEITVPWFDKANKDRELVVVEKNTNLFKMVDPINTNLALFVLADLSRLQIWVHPPEEYLEKFQKMLESPGGAARSGIFNSRPIREKSCLPCASRRLPSLEPNQHTPMLMGYLNNPDVEVKRIVANRGPTVPPRGEEIPGWPVCHGDDPCGPRREHGANSHGSPQRGQRRGPGLRATGQDEGRVLRETSRGRTSFQGSDVCASFSSALVRRSPFDLEVNNLKKRPLESLEPGERVVTRGVVELTAALDDLLTKEKK